MKIKSNLSLEINSETIKILTILSLPIHEHNIFLYLFKSPLIFSNAL